jgi:chromosomal replication initiation ATPase DnaA
MSEQLALDLPVRTARGREAFFVSPSNATALALIDRWPRWPGGRLALTGPEGAGKTHLAHVWAERSGAHFVRADGLAGEDPFELGAGATVVEDVDGGAFGPEAEPALFHLLNAQAERGGHLLLTGRMPPARWPVALPDLASRLGAVTPARIDAPDDALMAALLVKHFADRQLRVSPTLVSWLLPRIERSAAAAAAAVERLDREALARGMPPGPGLARLLFASPALDSPEAGA